MVKIKLLLHRSKPVCVFLAEQQPDVEILFFNYQVHHKEFDISPTFSIKGSIIKAIADRYGEYTLHVDKPDNLSQYPCEDIPFVILGDGDILLKMATSLDRRKEEFMELEPKKKRPGMLFGDDEGGDDMMGGLFSDDKDGGDSMPMPGDGMPESEPGNEDSNPEDDKI